MLQRQGGGGAESCGDALRDSFQRWNYTLCLRGLFFLFHLAQSLPILNTAEKVQYHALSLDVRGLSAGVSLRLN